MDIEVSNFEDDIRRQIRVKMRRYRADLDDARKKFLKAEAELMDLKNRENILG